MRTSLEFPNVYQMIKKSSLRRYHLLQGSIVRSQNNATKQSWWRKGKTNTNRVLQRTTNITDKYWIQHTQKSTLLAGCSRSQAHLTYLLLSCVVAVPTKQHDTANARRWSASVWTRHQRHDLSPVLSAGGILFQHWTFGLLRQNIWTHMRINFWTSLAHAYILFFVE